MKQIDVFYLRVSGLYTDGQNLVCKEKAMMPSARIEYYLKGAKNRGLDFDFEVGQLEVSDEDVEDYQLCGYTITQKLDEENVNI